MKIPNFIPDGPSMADALRKIVSAIIAGWNVDHAADGGHRFSTTQTTVGSAGSATALPATPSAYVHVTYVDSNGITRQGVMPVYDDE
jgi:hypothetical protein